MCLEMEKTGVETSMNKKEGSALDLMTWDSEQLPYKKLVINMIEEGEEASKTLKTALEGLDSWEA